MTSKKDDEVGIQRAVFAEIFVWLNLGELKTFVESSKTASSLFHQFLSMGLSAKLPTALTTLRITRSLIEKIQLIKPSSALSCGENHFKNLLRSVLNVSSAKYKVRLAIMKRLFLLCPALQSLAIIHPTSAVIKKIRALNCLSQISLGQTGFSNVKCSDDSILVMLTAVGHQLLVLNITKLNCLTVKTLEGISHYCTKLEKLSITSCNGIRATSSNVQSREGATSNLKLSMNSTIVENMMKSIGHTIFEIDLRYSIEMNNGYLQIVMDTFSCKNLRVFIASRTISSTRKVDNPASKFSISGCGLPDYITNDLEEESEFALTDTRWESFVDHFRESTLLYIDNIGNEGRDETVYLYKRALLGGCSISTSLLEKVIFQLDDNLFRARKRLSTLPTTTDDDFSDVTKLDVRQCQKWASCALCQVMQRPTADNFGTNYISSNNTLISEDSKYSDEGFVDDAESARSSQSDEGFVNEIVSHDDYSVEEIHYESGATCLCVLLSMNSKDKLSDGNRWNYLSNRKQARHLERKDTFIRL